MARYFKFHSVEDLEAENTRLGLDLRFSTDLAPLFTNTNVAGFTVGNRLCVQPMEGCDGTLAGEPDALTFRRYERFGAGGAKLIWGEAAAVVDEGRANSRQLWIHAGTIASLEKMLKGCRDAHRQVLGRDDDLLVGLQLTHSGRYSYRQPLRAMHDPFLDPRTIVDKATGRTANVDDSLVDDGYLERLIRHYVTAAKLAFEAGYQFVDIKQCHRYLLNELLASRSRPGPFGGAFENRTRLAREIFQAIRRDVPGLILATRLNVFDSIPYQKDPGTGDGTPCSWQSPITSCWGTDANDPLQPDLAEPIRWIEAMRGFGVSLVNISMGNPYASPHLIRPFEYPPPDGYETPEHPLIGVDRHFRLAAEVQRAFPDLAVVGSGYSYLQEYLGLAGAANVRDGRTTFVGVGRATLSQPDFAYQLQTHGKLDRRRVCRTFSYCTALMRSKHNELGQFATGCPPFDKEIYGPLWDEAKKKA